MHFSRVVGGHAYDLYLSFDSPWAVEWEEESFGLLEMPSDLPLCTDKKFASWAFPTLLIEESGWAEKYAARRFVEGDPSAKKLQHYAMISLNDSLHVLSLKTTYARWLPGEA